MSSSYEVVDGAALLSSQAAVGHAFKKTDKTIQRWLDKGCPGADADGKYHLWKIIEWYVEYKTPRIEDAAELEMTGGDSPALERYRDEKAKLAKLDRLEREGVLVRKDALHDLLMSMAGLIRGAGDQLRRQFGNEALGILIEALDEMERLIGELNGDDDG